MRPDEVPPIEFPPGVHPPLSDLAHSAYKLPGEWGAKYRRSITSTSPLKFAITYFPDWLVQEDSFRMSFCRLHLELCLAAKEWIRPGPSRHAWIAPRQSGKALALDTPVLTVDRGWVTHGELKVGDRVFDELGQPCNVVGVSPTWQNRPCYQLTFSDGEQIVADENHEWLVDDRWRTRPGIEATREIADKWLLTTARGRQEVRYSLQVCKPLQYPSASLPIAPYVLGAWLGDGSSKAGELTCGSQDLEEMVSFLRAEGENPKPRCGGTAHLIAMAKPRPDRCRREHPLGPALPGKAGYYAPCRICMVLSDRRSPRWLPMGAGTNLPLLVRLRRADLLRNKHIPQEYFTASVDQRLALLQGLMDTDGYVGAGQPQCEFTGVNERLCRNVLRLAQTLGIKAKIAEGRATIGGVDKGTKWRVTFFTNLPVFRLSRKVARLAGRPEFKRSGRRQITNVERVEDQATSCVQVDSASHLYLVGRSLIPTHNSRWLFGILPIWAMAHGYRDYVTTFAFTKEQAADQLGNILDRLKEPNSLLLADFPELAPARGKGGPGRTVLVNGSTLDCKGMGGSASGKLGGKGRPKLVIGDEVDPDAEKNTLKIAAQNRGRFQKTILPLNINAAVMISGTVTMYDSFIHDFVHAAKGRPKGDWVTAQRFQVHHYPAIQEDGTSLWPQKWTLEVLMNEKAADEYGYKLNYDNDPDPPKGKTFWTPGLFQYDKNFDVAERVLHMDVAFTVGGDADFTCLALAGRDRSGRRALVERVEWGHWTIDEMRDRLNSFCNPLTVKPLVRIERNKGGEHWLSAVRPWPLGVDMETAWSSAPKEDRIRWGHEYYRARAVWHPWKDPDLEDELCLWPRGKRDDVPDAVTMAVGWCFQAPWAMT